MTFDTSSYGQGNDAPNMLSNMQGWMGLAQQGSQNKLLKQQVQAKAAAADIYKSAPLNQYGQPDENYLMQNAGAAGIMAPEVIQNAQSQKQSNIDIQTKLLGMQESQLALSKNINGTVASSASTLVPDIQAAKNGQGPYVTDGQWDPAKALKALASTKADIIAASTGPDGKPTYTPQQAVQDLQGVDASNPDSMTQYLVSKSAQAQAALGHINEALDIKRGALGSAQVGGMTQPTAQNVFTGTTTPAGQAVPTGTGVTSSGIPVFNSQVVPTSNDFSPSNSQNPNTIRGSLGTGVQGAPLPVPSQATSLQGQPVYPAAAPGVAEAVSATNVAGGTQLAADRASTATSQATLTNMKMAYDSLQAAPTGRGSGELQKLKNFAIWAAPELADKDFGKQAANYDTATAALNDQARQLAAQFGPHTNANLDATFSAKPNTEQTKAAALALQEKIMSLTRTNYARTMFHDSPFNGIKTGKVDLSNTSPANYQQWSNSFNQTVDPVALGADLMEPQKLASYYQGLSKVPNPTTGLSPRDRFNNGYNLGVAYGFQNHVAGQ